MPVIRVANDGIEVESSAAISVLNTLMRAVIAIDHRCGGHAQCGTCRVRVIEGMQYFSPVREPERLKLAKFSDNHSLRLACQSYVFGDVTIEIQSRTNPTRRTEQ